MKSIFLVVCESSALVNFKNPDKHQENYALETTIEWSHEEGLKRTFETSTSSGVGNESNVRTDCYELYILLAAFLSSPTFSAVPQN